METEDYHLSQGPRRTGVGPAAAVHKVFSLLKRWLLETHQGAVRAGHLQDYLDEFAFRFNPRKSRRRSKLFHRLAQQAVTTKPSTYRQIADSAQTQNAPDRHPSGVPESNG